MPSRILVVEDDPDNFDIIRILLERLGHSVIASRNGKEGLKTALSHQPDLILLDLSLPEMDGWQTAISLRANPRSFQIPLIAITAHSLPEDRARAFSAGFNDYLTKPIDVSLFDQAVARALNKQPSTLNPTHE